MFRFYNFGSFRATTIFLAQVLHPTTFEKITCYFIKGLLQLNIVSCCASSFFTEADIDGHRLQLNTANTTNVTVTVEFNAKIVYTDNATCSNTCQLAFVDAINSSVFGNMIGGTVVDLEQQSSSSKSSKSGTSDGSMKSSKSMKSGSS